jgi:cyanate permease
VVAYASFSVIAPVLIIHSVPFVTDMGIDPVKAAVIVGLMSICGTPGTFIGGFVADRFKKQHLRFLQAGAYFLQIIGFIAFLLNQTLAMVYPLLILHNLSMAITAPLTGVISARYFGRKAFGSIRATLMVFMLPVAVLAPIYAGWVFDTTGSYITVFIVCVALLALSTIVISLASPPKLTDQVTDIHKIT